MFEFQNKILSQENRKILSENWKSEKKNSFIFIFVLSISWLRK